MSKETPLLTFEEIKRLLTDAPNPTADPNPALVSVCRTNEPDELAVAWGDAKLLAAGERPPRQNWVRVSPAQGAELVALGAFDHRNDRP